MVRIKRLTLKHFKSFKAATITFSPGFTVIMGPNGSGKSNIVDAILFVLGEGRLREIRASRLTDLVMRGAKDNTALVSIEIEANGRTYTISRSIDKKGRSVYRLDGKRTTRGAIRALLSSLGVPEEGYNVVLQGEVTRFLKMSPRERRGLLDAIAGISEYEERKEEAMRRLEDVEERIREVNIILGERKSVLERLKEEKEKAERYMQLKKYLQGIRRGLLERELDVVERRLARIKEEIERKTTERSKLEEQRKLLESQLKEMELEVEEKRRRFEELLKRSGEGELLIVEQEMEQKRRELAETKKRIAELEASIRELEKKAGETEAEITRILLDLETMRRRKGDVDEKINALQQKLQEIENKLSALPEVEEIRKIDEKINELEAEFHELEKEHARLLGEYNALVGKYEKMKERLEKFERKKELLEDLKRKKTGLESRRRELFEVEKALNKEYLEIEEKLKELREKLGSMKGMLSALRSLGVSRDVLEFLLEKQKRGELFGIHGFLADLIKFDDRYTRAIEAAGGRRLFYIVVDTADVAADAINLLKRHGVGRATFIPLDRIRVPRIDVPSGRGILGRLADFITTEERFRRAVEYAFGDTVLTEDIQVAKELAGRYRAVTLDGDLVERSGIMSGGKSQEFSILQAYKAEELKKNIQELETRKKEIVAELARTREKIHSTSDEIARILSEISKLEALQPPELPDLEEKARELKEMEQKMQQLAQQIASLRMKRDEYAKILGRKQRELLEKRDMWREELQSLQKDSKELEIAIVRLEERRQALQERKRSFEEETSRLREEFERFQERLKEIEKTLQELQERYEKLRKEVAKQREDVERVRKELEEAERSLDEVRQELAKVDAQLPAIEDKLLSLQGALAEVERKKRQILEDLREFKGVEAVFVDNPRAEIERVLEELQAMEPVNMAAITEDEEQKKKIEEVEAKLDKLRQEKRDVLNLLQEIERKKEEVFMKTFHAIASLFSDVYNQLTGGKAKLKLVGEKFEDYGLTVEVLPPRKKPVNIEALSGGEKAMAALAFLFAVAMHKPSGFYILDEPDLMLDKKNAERMAKFIKNMSKEKQFIVISHRDAVIKEADQIVGVYMGRDGTSVIELLPPASTAS